MIRLIKFIFVFLFCFSAFAVQAQIKNRARDERWRQDINYYAENLPKLHKNLFFRLSKQGFEREIRRLEKDISKSSDEQIILRLMTLTARVGDGHTQFYFDKLEDITIFPINLYQFPEGFYAVTTVPAYKAVLGKKLVRIGNIKIEKAARRVREVFAAENEFGVKDKMRIFLTVPFVLKAEKIIKSDREADYTFADERGKETTVRLKSQKYADFLKTEKSEFYDGKQKPLALKNDDKNYWSEYLPAEKTLYLAYNKCQEDEARPFEELTKEIFETVDKNTVEKFIVDLRRNGGGNSRVIHPLYAELEKRPALTAKGKFFVLTSRRTFSSGFLNAIEMNRKFGALWIGEPPSQAPVGYGEVKNFELPNSKLRVQYSTKKYIYDENEKLDYLPVDVAVEETFADYAKGTDKVLESVFNYQTNK